MHTQEGTPSLTAMDFATGRAVPDIDAIRTLEGASWFDGLRGLAFFTAPLIAPDPTLPALDAILTAHTTEVAGSTCTLCGLLARDNPARADCASCAYGEAA